MSTPFTEAWPPGPNGTAFYTRTYDPPVAARAVLVFIHGFIEHIARYEHVFSAYAQNGVAVFAFDQRGYGRTALDPGADGKRERDRKSRGEGYGRTSSEQQRTDIIWALNHAGKELAGWENGAQELPLFLMGHSMGGALVLSFGASPPSTFSHRLSGIIATSPLLAQTHPTPKIIRKAGGGASQLLPWITIPAAVKAEALTHDKEICEAYTKDPLIHQYATLRGVSTMLNLGDNLTSSGYKSWLVDLPVLLIHGDADQVTSHEATQNFYNNIKADDKSFSSYENGYHELHNEPQLKQRLLDEVISWIANHLSSHQDMASNMPGAKL